MKAEHRHELKTNDLAKTLFSFQDYAREYGPRVALGLAIAVLVVVLIFQRASRSRQMAAKVQNDLSFAREQIDRLSHAQLDFMGNLSVRPADVASVPKLLRDMKDETSDKKLLAEVLVAQGDYAWAMANFPNLPGATTNPSLRPEKDRGDLLKDAQAAYQAVLDQYSDQVMAVVAARFGLAAVAEQGRNWDEAKKQYETIKQMEKASDAFKTVASRKLERLEEIRQPVLVGQVPEKFEFPLPPSTTQASTQPATQAAAATTQPAKAGATTRPAGK
jgi:tetratricopeptide (TPR) repeat protein